MRIIVNSPDRLAMRTGVPVLHPATLVFDKDTGTATIERKILFYLLDARTIMLKSIREVHVVRRKTHKSSSYKPEITLNVGHPIELPGFDRESSKKAVKLIRDFLGME